MATWVRSPQVDEMDALENKDRRLYFKWGVEPSYWLLPKLRVSMRFDRVILDIYDSQNSFRVLSPKIAFPLDNWGEVFVQYSHYWYGDKVQLRPARCRSRASPTATCSSCRRRSSGSSDDTYSEAIVRDSRYDRLR